MNVQVFFSLADQMQKALDENKASVFSALVRKRSKLIHRLFEPDNRSLATEDLLRKLTDENRRWIAGAQQFLKETQAKIDKLQPTKTATRHLSEAYNVSRSHSGALLSQKG
jgi:hypothetical protein